MKRAQTLLFSVLCQLTSMAQSIPPQWEEWTGHSYMYDIQQETKKADQSESELCNHLVKQAITNLARQINVVIKDYASIIKTTDNGHASILYNAETDFRTDLNLKLVQTKSRYDFMSGTCYAIAYINKTDACRFYGNELESYLNEADSHINSAKTYSAKAFQSKAKQELELAGISLEKAEKHLFWLNIYGAADNTITSYRNRLLLTDNEIKRLTADQKYAIKIALRCHAEIGDKEYPALANQLKGAIANDNFSFTDDKNQADWIININSTSKKCDSRRIGNHTIYVSYVDADISIFKPVTSQCIYEENISVKGTHTNSERDAAIDAYKQLRDKLSTLINNNIDK